MSSEKFESLEEDFLSLKNEIQRKVENNLPKVSGESRKNTVREILRLIDRAERLLQELENEVRIAPNPYRLQMNSRVKQYWQEINKMKSRCNYSEDTSLLSSRNELFASNASSYRPGLDAEITAVNNRSRLLQMNDTLDRTSASISNAQRTAAETDEVAVAVVDELGTQRESLIRTKERLMDTDSNLSRSRKILRMMHRKVITNKLILIVIILFEIVILIGVVYYRFFKK